MESSIQEARRAKESAEKLFAVKDFAGAKRSALTAQAFCPQLEGIAHMVATFEIYAASEFKINGEVDLYSVIGLDPSVERSVLKKQYKKLAVLLHPDKNKTIGADEAFKLISEAWTVLSNNAKRKSYDAKRNRNLSGMFDRSNISAGVRSDTFWTVCTTCRVQYEYLRKYVNKRLSCKNCRGVFEAVETGTAPVAFCPWAYTTDNGFTNHSYTTATYGSAAFHSGNGSKLTNNLSFQWDTSAISDPTGFSYSSINHGHMTNGNVSTAKANGKTLGRPRKKRKLEVGDAPRTSNSETVPIMEPDVGVKSVLSRCYSVAPAFDARKLLIDKARYVIRVKLGEMKMASKAEKNEKVTKKMISVPDPDFHNFDMDRSEDVFKVKQIWAIYDEEDGMPRLYCLIREVLSVKPFRVYISYLNSKTDIEFGFVRWIESGFTKSCGSFRVFHSEVVDQVNIFSHLLGREKAGRGGCVRIYPKSGDIWAVYRKWSDEWSRKTPKEVIHQYEMVEVLGDYSDEHGICVAPMIKLDGYKTVYRRNPDELAVRWIPRREMLRFSHQVPSCLLKGQAQDLPDGCWDLDPAATPEELLYSGMKEKPEDAVARDAEGDR
uniref:uncharacterized protein LOC122596176 n=1 Tax=Erigeron canadensis TaxID=72917 RepID=UPI001CB963FE|nr:uncharacterized protein LOC122596176 [Erigeron canadensis]